MAEFSSSNQVSATTQTSHFLATSGIHPQMSFEFSIDPTPPVPQSSESFALILKKPQVFLRLEMRVAQDHQEQNANAYHTPAPTFQVGDLVWLSTKNIKTACPSKKLDHKRLSTLPIIEIVSPHAFCFDLPPSMKIDPVTHD